MAPVTFIAPCHCPSLKRGKSWVGIDINPNNTSLWVSTYLKRDSWLPEWWEEFRPPPRVADGCHRDAQAQYLAHPQAAAFHLPATQQVVYSIWLAPPSLVDLKRREYLGPKDPWLTWDYWEVWKKETVTLAIILQQCAIQAGTPLDMFCRAVQELHMCLALVMDKSNWANMEKEIWAGVMSASIVAASPKPHMSRRTQSHTPIAKKLMASIPPSTPKPEGTTPPEGLALVPRRQPPPPLGFSPKSQRSSSYQP